jgi:DNA-binding transcriptional LysR family regulator
MNLSLQRLRYFSAVAQFGSFRRAADELNITQPALSRQIRVLEDEVGAPLLNRSKRRVSLTPGGAHLLQRSSLLLDEAAVLVKEVRRFSEQEPPPLTLGVLQSLMSGIFPQALKLMKQEFGSAPVRVFGFQTQQIVTGVLHGEYDLGIVAGPLEHPKLLARQLFDEPYAAVLPRSHRLARRKVIEVRAMIAVPLVGSPVGQVIRQMVDRAAEGLPGWKYVAEMESIGAIIELVRAGIGGAVLPFSSVTPLPRGIVARRLQNDSGGPAIVRSVWAIQRAGATLPRIGRRLPDLLTKAAVAMPPL